MPEVTTNEAARRLGISTNTVRRRIKRGQLDARREDTPQGYQWLINLPEGEHPSSLENSTDHNGYHGEKALWEMMDLLRSQLDVKDQQINQLHALLGEGHTRMLPSSADRQAWWKFWGHFSSG